MLTLLTDNIRKNFSQIILLTLTIVSIILAIVIWQHHTKSNLLQHKFANLEKNFLKQRDLLAKQSTVTNLQSQLDTLQQNFASVYNKVENSDNVALAQSDVELKSVLLLTKLTAMQLFLNKDADISKSLLSQAINKLTKINDPRLNIVLYNLQDQYTNLGAEDKHLYTNQEIITKIDRIKTLAITLASSPEDNNLFKEQATDKQAEKTTKFLDLIKVSQLKPDKHANHSDKLSNLQLEAIKVYLEQAKLSYLQNNNLLFKQILTSIKNILAANNLSSDTVLDIQNELNWLESIKISDHKLILQAILQLEDYTK